MYIFDHKGCILSSEKDWEFYAEWLGVYAIRLGVYAIRLGVFAIVHGSSCSKVTNRARLDLLKMPSRNIRFDF